MAQLTESAFRIIRIQFRNSHHRRQKGAACYQTSRPRSFYGCATPRSASHQTTAEGILSRTGKSVQPQPVEATNSLPPGVSLDQPLSSDDAVGIALWNNPQLRADLATIGLAEADLIDAGLLRNPRLDVLMPMGHLNFC